MSKKTVLYPIEVPIGIYCWRYGLDETPPCQFFDNEGGVPSCNLNFSPQNQGHLGVIKPLKCDELKEAKDA